jgi:lambda repressor-like predicted transcriptional regulator
MSTTIFKERKKIMHNEDIRAEIKAAGLKLWHIAARLGMNDGNLSRKLRHELSPDQKSKIRRIIAELRGSNDE